MTVIDKFAIPPILFDAVGLDGGAEFWLADRTVGVGSPVGLGDGVASGVTVGEGVGVAVGVGVAAEVLSLPDLPDGVS
jgi:hypothetical protein